VTLLVHALVLINTDSNMHGDEININTLCGQYVEFATFKPVVRIVTTGL